ncbi:hypothetical protein [Corynebacterium flavescens]|uniref:hypothetical protein n=1 Tax=Corynebacterium flavescens TaxID=28028 RepID=UPI003FD278E2
MRQAYEAAGYEITESQLDERYEQMMSELTNKVVAQTGRSLVDAMIRDQLLRLSNQIAADEIRKLWLDPLTQEAIEAELKEHEENPPSLQVLNSPDLWMTQWHYLSSDSATWDLACELWPDAPTRWLSLASALMQVYEHQYKLYPGYKYSKLLPEFEAKIEHSMTLQKPPGTAA